MQLQLPLTNLVLSILPFRMAILSRINSFALSFLNLNLSLRAEVVSMEACFASLKSGAGIAVLVRLLPVFARTACFPSEVGASKRNPCLGPVGAA